MKRSVKVKIIVLAALLPLLLSVGADFRRQDPIERDVARQRFDAAKVVIDLMAAARQNARPLDQAMQMEPELLWLHSAAEAASVCDKRIALEACARYEARASELRDQAKLLFSAGRRSAVDVAVLDYYLADAAYLLDRAKAR